MTLGERLLEYRTNLKISQDSLAEKLGVTRQTISKWETDQSMPEFNKILPLCELFGITTDELIKEKKPETADEEEQVKKENLTYNERRNKKKAIFISISVFLYIIGAFSTPYMIESLNYDDEHAIMVLGVLWAIATVLLIYFFVSNPREKKGNIVIRNNKKIERSIENRIITIVILTFLSIYFVISFITGAWHITWILWIVCIIVQVIIKIIFDLKRGKNNE